MILDQLTLHNFGVYRGEQQIDLTPTPGRPIVLVGALNGGGKTTLLDALQVVLYGRHARCIDRTKTSYQDYLRRSIHREVLPSVGAGIELRFRYRLEGRDERFRIFRSWRDTGATIKETVEVYRNDDLDPAATERWGEFVEQFIPNQISDLFFFDGEKIESLADPERSSELLRVGVHALLGLDLVDDLTRSMIQVERRRKARLIATEDEGSLRQLEEGLEQLVRARAEMAGKMASAQIEVDESSKILGHLEKRLKAEGGDLYAKRRELEGALAVKREALGHIEERIREYAAGMGPLLLLGGMIQDLRNAVGDEAGALREQQFRELLEQRDRDVLAKLEKSKVSAIDLRHFAKALEADRRARAESKGKPFLNIDVGLLGPYSAEALAEVAHQIKDAVDRHGSVREEIVRLEAALAAVPDESKIQDLLHEMSVGREGLRNATARLQLLTEEHSKIERERFGSELERDRFLEKLSEQRAADIITKKVIAHASQSRETLKKFRRAMRERHVSKLERIVTECFQELLRKKTLVHHVSISAETFDLRIRGENDMPVPAERLSAGERQLLAVSILWGLAKASGRQLPAIIDTPLGRLDSEHRACLIRHYFPVASHQVILLSTDEEIDGAYYAELKHAVGREFLITYDDKTHSSTIEPGYFAQARIAA